MSGRLRREALTVAEQHQPGCRADRQEASDGSVAWRVLGREPRHHSSIRRLGSLHLAGTARQHPSSVPSWEARRDRVGSKGASPQALIDNIPIALCTGALSSLQGPDTSGSFSFSARNGRVATCPETHTQGSGAGLEMRRNTQTLVLLPISTSSLRWGKRPVGMDVTD